MAAILFCWELGAGLGHVAPHLRLADDLARQGHRVTFALRQTDKAGKLIDRSGHVFVQAPIPTTAPVRCINFPCSYPHILHNSGYHDTYTLLGLVRSWRVLFRALQPDLLVCEHAPTALLASRGLGIRRAIIANGFTLPPRTYPLANLRTWLDIDPERLQRDEDRVCDTLNRVLKSLKVPPLERIADLFETEPSFLRTLEELDPYERPSPAEYWGTSFLATGAPVAWPDGNGPRVFAYLKPSALLGPVLENLAARRCPTLVVCPGLSRRSQQRYASDTLTFSERPVNMQEVLEQCDLGVLNATLNSVINFLLAGKPMLLLPLALEHLLTARRVEHEGAGIDVSQAPHEAIGDAVEQVIESDRFATAAKAFAARYTNFDTREMDARLTQRFSALLG